MKAIILAAGKWTRLKPLTETTPKPMIFIAWKTIIEHTLEIIHDEVDEIIIVVKYLKEKISTYFWDDFLGTKISYHIQNDEKGTWAAIKWINFNDDFILINWDNIFEKKDIKKLIKINWYWCLTREVEDTSNYWVFLKNSDNIAEKIIEKPSKFYWNTTNIWAYKFSAEMLQLVKKIKISSRWEYEITDAINFFIQNNKFSLINIEWKFLDISYPWDILLANKYFLEKLEKSVLNWEVEERVTIKWNILLWKWSILKSWTYIEWNVIFWENCIIWPNCYIRWNTVFWDNCKVWNAVEVKNSSIWNDTNILHLSYLWDSVVWNNCNFGAGFKVANLRHDEKNMRAIIKWNLVDTWLKKLWIIIGDNCKIWISNVCYPARILQSNSFTLPWEIIK